MFYCEKCAKQREWPSDPFVPRSTGKCEICNIPAVCYDAPSIALPLPKKD